MQHFYNKYNLGDCLVSIHFLNKLLEKNNFECNFYCKDEYHKELQPLINSNSKINLNPASESKGINLWVSNILWRVKDVEGENYPFFSKKYPHLEDVCEMVFKSHKLLCLENNFIFPYNNKFDIFFDEEIVLKDSNIGQYDYIIVNSDCNSGQVHFTSQENDNIFTSIITQIISQGSSFITTKKHGEYPCTCDYGLTIGEIGQLSKNCKMVIGVPTSPFWILINKNSLNNDIKFLNITEDICTYDIDSVDTIKGSYSEQINYFNNIFTLPK